MKYSTNEVKLSVYVMGYSPARYTPLITKGYITRRIAIEHAIPLVTDIKCAKLLVKVGHEMDI